MYIGVLDDDDDITKGTHNDRKVRNQSFLDNCISFDFWQWCQSGKRV